MTWHNFVYILLICACTFNREVASQNARLCEARSRFLSFAGVTDCVNSTLRESVRVNYEIRERAPVWTVSSTVEGASADQLLTSLLDYVEGANSDNQAIDWLLPMQLFFTKLDDSVVFSNSARLFLDFPLEEQPPNPTNTNLILKWIKEVETITTEYFGFNDEETVNEHAQTILKGLPSEFANSVSIITWSGYNNMPRFGLFRQSLPSEMRFSSEVGFELS